jgi:hypothetical protein
MRTELSGRGSQVASALESARSNPRWSFATSIGSIVSALVAASSCVGPLVFALLGLGGAGLFARLECYQPYLIVLTFALLGSGFYITYRKPTAANEGATADADCASQAPRAKRMAKVVLWVATFLVLSFLLLPFVAPHLLG